MKRNSAGFARSLICVLMVGLFACLQVGCDVMGSGPSDDPEKYSKHYTEWREWNEKHIKHFPQSVNPDSVFYYRFQSPALQGGWIFHVGIELNEEEFERIKKHTETFERSETQKKPSRPSFPYEFNFKSHYIEAYAPEGSDIIVVYGIAISRDDSRAIYFAEVW